MVTRRAQLIAIIAATPGLAALWMRPSIEAAVDRIIEAEAAGE